MNTAEPYHLPDVDRRAWPRDETLRAVDSIDFDVHVPRLSHHKAEDGDYVYWRWSCNRRVANVNQPFCTQEHQAARAKHMRALRKDRAKPLRVPRPVVEKMHVKRSALIDAVRDFNNAEAKDAEAAAWAEVEEAVDDLSVYLRMNLPALPVSSREPPMQPQWKSNRQRAKGET